MYKINLEYNFKARDSVQMGGALHLRCEKSSNQISSLGGRWEDEGKGS